MATRTSTGRTAVPTGSAGASGPAAAVTVILKDVEDRIRNACRRIGWSATAFENVPAGKSCVEASETRAHAIAAELRRAAGPCVFEIGTIAGYRLLTWETGAHDVKSLHTYTVVMVFDHAHHVPLATYDVDDYVGLLSIRNNLRLVLWAGSGENLLHTIRVP